MKRIVTKTFLYITFADGQKGNSYTGHVVGFEYFSKENGFSHNETLDISHLTIGMSYHLDVDKGDCVLRLADNVTNLWIDTTKNPTLNNRKEFILDIENWKEVPTHRPVFASLVSPDDLHADVLHLLELRDPMTQDVYFIQALTNGKYFANVNNTGQLSMNFKEVASLFI